MSNNLTAAVKNQESAVQTFRPRTKKTETDEFSDILSVLANTRYIAPETGRLGSTANIIRDIQTRSSAEAREKRLSDLFKREEQAPEAVPAGRQEKTTKNADELSAGGVSDGKAAEKPADDGKISAEAKKTSEMPADILALLKNSKAQTKVETASAAQSRAEISAVMQNQAESLKLRKDNDIKMPDQDSLKQAVKEAMVKPAQKAERDLQTDMPAGRKQELPELLNGQRDAKKTKVQKDAQKELDSASQEASLREAQVKKDETSAALENTERKNQSVKVKEARSEQRSEDKAGFSEKNDTESGSRESLQLSADRKKPAESSHAAQEKPSAVPVPEAEAAAAQESMSVKRQEYETLTQAARKESFFTVNSSKFDLKKDMNSGDSRSGAGNLGDMGTAGLRADGQKNAQESKGAKFSSVYRYQNEKPVDRKDNFDQIVKNAKVSFDSGKTDMKIQLKPEFLGKMELKVVLENGSISAKITTENAELKNLINVSIDELKEMLSAGGLNVSSVDVQLAGGENSSGGSFGESGGAHRPSHKGGVEVPAEQTTQESREYGMYWRNATVNYII